MLTTQAILKRIRNGEEPIDVALAEWHAFLADAKRRDLAAIKTHSISYRACALCVASIPSPVGNWHPACHTCPVGRETTASGCHGTPYHDVARTYLSMTGRGVVPTNDQWRNLETAIQREIDFLENVKAGSGYDWLKRENDDHVRQTA